MTGTGVPVLVNTGLRASNAAELLRFADGAIVGSSLKVDGVTWNPVDERRVRELMDVVNGLSDIPAQVMQGEKSLQIDTFAT